MKAFSALSLHIWAALRFVLVPGSTFQSSFCDISSSYISVLSTHTRRSATATAIFGGGGGE